MKGRLTMSSKYVIKPLDKASLEKFFDSEAQKVIRFYIAKSLFAQPETLDTQGNLPIHIPKEHIEQWAVQALGVSSVGAGSYPVDVINESGVRWGADIKMLSCKVNEGELTRAESGETSLSQKFTGAGNMLDAMFNDKKYHKIIQDFVEIYSNKMHTVMKEKNLNDVYYFFLLRAGTKFYICGMKIFLNNLKHVKYLRNTNKNVWTENFLEEKYGSVRVFQSKKRMELRLRPKQWKDDDLLIEFDTNGLIPTTNIKSIINQPTKLKEHIDVLINELYGSIMK
jgi:hypothetical protein